MSKKKLLSAVITTAIAMTGVCTQISEHVVPENKTSIETKNTESLRKVRNEKK